MWQPLGSVAPALRLIAKRFLSSHASPVTLCGTAAVARCPAAIARNPLMSKTSPLLRAAWYGICFVWSYSRGRSGVRPRPGRQAAFQSTGGKRRSRILVSFRVAQVADAVIEARYSTEGGKDGNRRETVGSE
jgi:hypothetical protein